MRIFAHRGNSSVYPENTMAAFRSALSVGAEGIETDVHLTKDGILVITHDEEISRVSDGKGQVKDMTLEELQRYDFGSWKGDAYKGEKIPALQELLDRRSHAVLLGQHNPQLQGRTYRHHHRQRPSAAFPARR